jgi:hypothetical protein
MKTIRIRTAVAAVLLAPLSAVPAANWLMLQGTEPASAAPRAKVWGLIQAQYQKDYSDPNASDGYIPPKLIGPELETQDTFNINRARLAVRGAGFPLDDKINYQNVQPDGANPPGADGATGKAWGAYLEGGWYIPDTPWELDARYEHYVRMTDDSGHPSGNSFESVWKTLTLGVQYHFNPKTRVAFNYLFRDVQTPDFDTGVGPNAQMDGIDDRLALQVTAIF